MGRRILKKKYGRIEFTLASPLALSSGEQRYTDRDLMKDTLGRPYIPAAAIAGVTREFLEREGKKVRDYYGDIDKNNENMQAESRLIFYDAVLRKDSPVYICVRDSVALNEYKTSIKGAKFDMEVLETGATFVTYLEQNFYGEQNEEDYIKYIEGVFISGVISFGGKTMRGYGEITDIKLYEKEFSFQEKKNSEDVGDLEDWLEFDLYKDQGWKDVTAQALGKRKELTLFLRQKGGISIRQYTTQVREHDNEAVPDYEQLMAHGSGETEPVIPGTSWAGAFKHRMGEFGVPVNESGSIFGFVEKQQKEDIGASEEEKKQDVGRGMSVEKSKIRFGESRIHGVKEKILSRNAIDRFTGKTVDGALFTEKTYYGGYTELKIGWDVKDKMEEKEQQALAAAVADLHYGYLAVGGETSIGRGLFTVTKISAGETSFELSEKDERLMVTKIVDGKNVYECMETDEQRNLVFESALNLIREVFGSNLLS